MRWLKSLCMTGLLLGLILPMGRVFADTPLVSVNLQPVNAGGPAGTASLTANGLNQTRVVITADPPDTVYSVAVYRGSCAHLDTLPAYPLNAPQQGNSNTVLNVSLTDLTTGGYAINMQVTSGARACGDIPTQTTPPFVEEPSQGPSGPPSGMPRTGVPLSWALVLIAGLVLSLIGLSLRHRPCA